jgi:hypothetical protein
LFEGAAVTRFENLDLASEAAFVTREIMKSSSAFAEKQLFSALVAAIMVS